MNTRPKLAVLSASFCLALGVSACGTSTVTQPAPETSPAVQSRTTSAAPGSATPTVAPVATTTLRPNVSPDEECAGSKFSVAQFIGAWQDGPAVTTLSEHGSLDSNVNGDKQFGTWQFKPAGQTPAASSVPVAATCVLWFHWMDEPQQDAFYVPLKVSDTSLQLSYVGRGNTIVWERTAG
ncbi:hypothetical protein [Mycobacterium sp. 48b]|uniref:hypothetical protein n=1 Tax=Mycobacterium sp. 48b TaxID=3400426 RepID=UPI003AAEC352